MDPGQINAPQQVLPAPGPHLQPLFQQGIPPQQAMANPMALNPFGNLQFQNLFMPLPAMQTVPPAIFGGQSLPTANAVMPMDEEEKKGVKRKRSDPLNEDATAAGRAEDLAFRMTKRIRHAVGALESPEFKEGYFRPDETLLLPGELEDLTAKLKRQSELEGQHGVVLENIRKLLTDGSMNEDQRQAAIDILEDLTHQGYARSAYALVAVILANPDGPKLELEDMMNYYKIGAELGCRECCFAMGAHLKENNTDGAKDAEVAYCWRVAAALGHPKARFNYAQLLLQGIGVAADPVKAIALIEDNAESLNQPEAEYKLAQELRSGRHVAKDLPRAYELFRRAASKGHIASKLNLAAVLFYGEGTAANKPEACALYKSCADGGDKVAQYNYAVMKLLGDGVDINVEEGIRYLQLSADQSYPSALHALALRYAAGDGVAMDKKKAFELYRKAAEAAKHVKSIFQLGKMYEAGDVIEYDIVKALEHYVLAYSMEAPVLHKLKSVMKVEMKRGEYLI